MFDENKIKLIKKLYPEGTKVELISMDDDYPVPSGTQGVVDHIDSIGTIFVNWDNGSTLGLIYGEDEFIVINEKEL